MTIKDIPLPAMPDPQPVELWGIAFGREYAVAMPSQHDAQLTKELCDDLDAKTRAKGGARFNDVSVLPWPGTPEEHARGLQDEEFALPLAVTR